MHEWLHRERESVCACVWKRNKIGVMRHNFISCNQSIAFMNVCIYIFQAARHLGGRASQVCVCTHACMHSHSCIHHVYACLIAVNHNFLVWFFFFKCNISDLTKKLVYCMVYLSVFLESFTPVLICSFQENNFQMYPLKQRCDLHKNEYWTRRDHESLNKSKYKLSKHSLNKQVLLKMGCR